MRRESVDTPRDGDQAVRDLAVRILERAGYEVIEAAGAKAALEQANQRETRNLQNQLQDLNSEYGENQTKLATLESRDYFGEMSILDGEPRSASVSAETDCLLLCINQADFHDILSRHFEVALTIIKTLTHRLRTAAARQAEDRKDETASETPSSN